MPNSSDNTSNDPSNKDNLQTSTEEKTPAIEIKNIDAELDKSAKKSKKASSRKIPFSEPVYVRANKGFYQKLRLVGSWFLMLLFACVPWINYQSHQAVHFDLEKQQFIFFGSTFFPQDLPLFALFLMISAFGLFFLTTFLGRIWCGYLCPQTVWTFLYIWFEEKLEGNANKRRKQDSLPLTLNLAGRKALKHVIWLLIALATALTFIGYFVPIRLLLPEFFTLKLSSWVFFWVFFFTICTYGNAGWLRRIMCFHICPYGRFQSVMFDSDTYVVGYDAKRGEIRGPRSRKAPKSDQLGDCIDCDLCVQVCPSGIDIREGLQYECINCGACIDACNSTMKQMGYAPDLISYTTEHKLQGKKSKVFRPKLLGYGSVMLVMIGVLMFQASHIEPAGLTVLRDRNQLYRENVQGEVENTYTLKVINKTQQSHRYQLSVEGLDEFVWYGPKDLMVEAGEVESLPISLGVKQGSLNVSIKTIYFVLSDGKNTEIKVESRFINAL